MNMEVGANWVEEVNWIEEGEWLDMGEGGSDNYG
jgi:hypothetical protein